MQSIRVKLRSTPRIVSFREIFHGTKEAFFGLLGRELEESEIGSFSYGSISGGIPVKDQKNGGTSLSFSNGGSWNFSTINKELMDEIFMGLIKKKSSFIFGMEIDKCEPYYKRIVSGDNCFIARPGIGLTDPQDHVHQLSYETDGKELFDSIEEHTRNTVSKFFPDINVDALFIKGVESQDVEYRRKTAMLDSRRVFFTEGPIIISGPSELVNIVAHIGIGDKTHLGMGYLQPISMKEEYQPLH